MLSYTNPSPSAKPDGGRVREGGSPFPWLNYHPMKKKPRKTMLDEPNFLLPPEFDFTFDVDFDPDRERVTQRRVEAVFKTFHPDTKSKFESTRTEL